jgi:hypothetical protein
LESGRLWEPWEIRILKGPACLINWRIETPGEAGANEEPSEEAAGQADGSGVESAQEDNELSVVEEAVGLRRSGRGTLRVKKGEDIHY